MAIIITYDVPSKHVELKQRMFALDYKDRIVHEGKYIYLPNTTLYHAIKTAEQARNDIQSICAALNIKLERCVSTIWNQWAAIHGEPF